MSAEIREELIFHVDEATRENVRRGMSPAEARRTALAAFGGVERFQEETRDTHGARWLEDAANDLRFGLRMLRADRAFAAAAMATLALGIAANTIVFSLANSLLLAPLPARDPERIVTLFTSTDPRLPFGSSSYPQYLDIRDAAADVLSGLAVYGIAPVDLHGERGERLIAATVSGNYFTVLGIDPLHGRFITAADDNRASPSFVAVLNERVWRDLFGSDPHIIGRVIRLNRQAYTVIGVVGRQYSAVRRLFDGDVFVPMATRELLAGESLSSRTARQFFLLGRLGPGVSIAQAQARMNVAASVLRVRDPQHWSTREGRAGMISVVSERDSRVPPSARLGVAAVLVFLQAMVGIVLVIGCVNLASLALARALAREREIAIRVALGSTPARLIRQLLTETALLTIPAGALAILLAWWGMRSLSSVSTQLGTSLHLAFTLDHRVLLFVSLVTLATAGFFGLVPAMQAMRTDVASALKAAGGGTPGRRRGRLGRALIIAELTMSLVLLVCAGLFIRSVREVGKIDLGFEATHLALASISLDPQRYDSVTGMQRLDGLVHRIRALPGVVDADWATAVPLSGSVNSRQVGAVGVGDASSTVLMNAVGAAYFSTLGIRVLRGRAFTAQDNANASRVMVVNQALADLYWKGQDPIGKHLVLDNEAATPVEVIGLVRTGKYESVTEDATPYFYQPLGQRYEGAAILHARTRGAPRDMLEAIAAIVHSEDAQIPVFDQSTMDDRLLVSVGPYRTAASLLTLFGALGLLLSWIGLYGVISYTTTRRKREMAIRMAVGAPKEAILRLFMRDGVQLVMIGIAVGVPISVGIAQLIRGFLMNVSTLDVITYAVVIVGLSLISLGAVYLPARRATRDEPFDALREA